jgi:hypothetical protein
MDTLSSYNLFTAATGELFYQLIQTKKIMLSNQNFLCEILWQPTVFIDNGGQRNFGGEVSYKFSTISLLLHDKQN